MTGCKQGKQLYNCFNIKQQESINEITDFEKEISSFWAFLEYYALKEKIIIIIWKRKGKKRRERCSNGREKLEKIWLDHTQLVFVFLFSLKYLWLFFVLELYSNSILILELYNVLKQVIELSIYFMTIISFKTL